MLKPMMLAAGLILGATLGGTAPTPAAAAAPAVEAQAPTAWAQYGYHRRHGHWGRPYGYRRHFGPPYGRAYGFRRHHHYGYHPGHGRRFYGGPRGYGRF
ncbi:hypothetical protein [Methylobacterium oryzihabitans]|uniref:Sulfur globule protein n=1 Tax=Methylobacterium oryzihabitans TaxID=2499852 RepID=A0A3S2VJY2_9HYPH|nr:hypothetical protein [Methylobacterium oryzihabitans]RVU14545.1 hypothetical protein EOE48_22680 [Methylobacterium oryzihabitans]